MAAAQMLFEAASVDPKPKGAVAATELIDCHRELQPWREQDLACKHLRPMTAVAATPAPPVRPRPFCCGS